MYNNDQLNLTIQLHNKIVSRFSFLNIFRVYEQNMKPWEMALKSQAIMVDNE